MTPGSVIVDLAAETGGNCELSRPGETSSTRAASRSIGVKNLPSSMPLHASFLYSRNIAEFLHSSSRRELSPRTSTTRSSPVRASHTGAKSAMPPPASCSKEGHR